MTNNKLTSIPGFVSKYISSGVNLSLIVLFLDTGSLHELESMYIFRYFFLLDLVGTAQSVGCSIERTPPHDIIDKINSGEIEVPDVSSLKKSNIHTQRRNEKLLLCLEIHLKMYVDNFDSLHYIAFYFSGVDRALCTKENNRKKK